MVFMALPSERTTYEKAAEITDKELSTWMRDALNAYAAQLLSAASAPAVPVKKKPKASRKTAQ